MSSVERYLSPCSRLREVTVFSSGPTEKLDSSPFATRRRPSGRQFVDPVSGKRFWAVDGAFDPRLKARADTRGSKGSGKRINGITRADIIEQ